MERYSNLGGDSGVRGYEIGSDHIIVWFKGNTKSYTYSYRRAGSSHVENMNNLAIKGHGLNSYIMRHVKNLYD